jgi:hypothetical protein
VTEAREQFDYPIKDERAQLLLGLDAPSVASADGLRNFAPSYGDDNPLFVDSWHGPRRGGFARSAGFALLLRDLPLRRTNAGMR